MVELRPEISERLNIQRIIPYKGVTLSADLKMRLKNAFPSNVTYLEAVARRELAGNLAAPSFWILSIPMDVSAERESGESLGPPRTTFTALVISAAPSLVVKAIRPLVAFHRFDLSLEAAERNYMVLRLCLLWTNHRYLDLQTNSLELFFSDGVFCKFVCKKWFFSSTNNKYTDTLIKFAKIKIMLNTI